MRRYPRPSHTQPIVDSVDASFVLMIITVCCPPLGLLAYVIYALFADWFNSIRKYFSIFIKYFPKGIDKSGLI